MKCVHCGCLMARGGAGGGAGADGDLQMNDNAVFAVIVASCMVSCTACSVTEKVLDAQQTPQQVCVSRAITQADRMQCLQVKP